MESGGSIQGRGSVSTDTLGLRSTDKRTEEAKGSVRFSGGLRTVQSVRPDTSLRLEQGKSEIETKAGSKELSDRAVRDVSDGKPGFLRRGGSLLRKGIGKVATAVYDKGSEKLKSGKKQAGLALEKAKNLKETAKEAGKEFVHNPVDTTLAVAHGVYQYSQGKVQAAKGAISSFGGAVASGATALRKNPKETLKTGGGVVLRSLKARSVSVLHNVSRLVPARVKNISLPSIKSILSRQAKEVPPQSSASLKTSAK